MVNRKRLLCTALSCLLSFSNLNISLASKVPNSQNSFSGKLNKDQVYELMIECLNNADNAISNLNFDKSSGYLTLPLCNGFYSVNAFCSPRSVSNRNFIRGVTIDMMLSTFMYHLNVAHMMTPEERKANWNSVSLKIARWLGEGKLPEGTQNSYSFWTLENAKIFNKCQENASEEAYDLMEELLNNYDDMYNAYENVFISALKKVVESNSAEKNRNVSNGSSEEKISNKNSKGDLSEVETNVEDNNLDENVENSLQTEVNVNNTENQEQDKSSRNDKIKNSDSNAKNEDINTAQEISNLNDAEVEEIKDYIFEQIRNAYEHLTFLKENNYIVLPVCDGYWATNLYCSSELAKSPDFSKGVVIDIILSIFMFSLNKTYHMSPEEREANKDKIYVKISRWLGEGKLPEGTQNSYAFWKNNDNIKLFNICQCNACDYACDLMEEHFNVYESQNGPKSIQRIFESLYDESNDVNNDKNQEQSEPSVSDEVKTSDSVIKGGNINNDSSEEKGLSRNDKDDLSELETDVEENNLDENTENGLQDEVEI